ncbi:Hpr(Ser) kinase/phosphatase [Novosphingobium sp. PhB165]|uniref:HPr kinase/phosphorylase n=1 Tax=Novosphingobium sp. PhB165 TaxID=2485105 RepID=UPI00104D1C87|nr:HPr kinase/phosphatase C-terminal domain-containing protein [Novosphingobium sp. PhB165]TCM21860.1 Hpr(Ser) kinase/phosphatase [Novosphingobium sp. PhB165]
MTGTPPLVRQATSVAIDGRAILIEGDSGTGKSSLALELIDRGAVLVGDDAVLLEVSGNRLLAHPHPNTRGLVEVRNLGILPFPCAEEATVALVIVLNPQAPRFIEAADTIEIAGIAIPLVRLWPHAGPLALKAELALSHFGNRVC